MSYRSPSWHEHPLRCISYLRDLPYGSASPQLVVYGFEPLDLVEGKSEALLKHHQSKPPRGKLNGCAITSLQNSPKQDLSLGGHPSQGSMLGTNLTSPTRAWHLFRPSATEPNNRTSRTRAKARVKAGLLAHPFSRLVRVGHLLVKELVMSCKCGWCW